MMGCHRVFAFLAMGADTKANALCVPIMHLSYISSPVTHSVGFNEITGDAAGHLATVVLEHAIMTDFCGIPLASLRENSITELDLCKKGVGVPGAIVLSKLLPSAAALTSLKCACQKCLLSCQCPLTHACPTPTFTAYAPTSSVVSVQSAISSTPPRASPSCVRGLREAP